MGDSVKLKLPCDDASPPFSLELITRWSIENSNVIRRILGESILNRITGKGYEKEKGYEQIIENNIF